jgi:hypothetical protein
MFSAAMLRAPTPLNFPVGDSYLRQVVRPGGPSHMPEIRIWTSMVPHTEALILLKQVEGRGVSFWPGIPSSVAKHIMEFAMPQAQILFVQREEPAEFTLTRLEEIVQFQTLAIAPPSARELAYIIEMFYFGAPPTAVAAMSELVDDIIEILSVLGEDRVKLLKLGSTFFLFVA